MVFLCKVIWGNHFVRHISSSSNMEFESYNSTITKLTQPRNEQNLTYHSKGGSKNDGWGMFWLLSD